MLILRWAESARVIPSKLYYILVCSFIQSIFLTVAVVARPQSHPTFTADKVVKKEQ